MLLIFIIIQKCPIYDESRSTELIFDIYNICFLNKSIIEFAIFKD
jgi:hypothetical protein